MNDFFDYLDEEETCGENEFLLTNFDKNKRGRYEEAIRIYGGDNLYIRDEAYCRDGRLGKDMNALMFKYCEELGEFWRIFESIS